MAEVSFGDPRIPNKPYADDPFVIPSEKMSEEELRHLPTRKRRIRDVTLVFSNTPAAVHTVDALSQLGLHVRREVDRELDDFSIYFCNLPITMSKEDLADMAAACGEVLMSWIVGYHCTPTMECGCGFVRMRRAADCVTAVRYFNGAFLDGYALPLRVRLGHKRKLVAYLSVSSKYSSWCA